VENLARSVDKEEKTEIELFIRAYLLERISHVANTGIHLYDYLREYWFCCSANLFQRGSRS